MINLVNTFYMEILSQKRNFLNKLTIILTTNNTRSNFIMRCLELSKDLAENI